MSRTAFYSFYLLVAAGMAYLNDLFCTYGWVMSACPTYEWVTSHERTSHVPRRNQSYQHINESCHVQFLIPLLAGGCCAGIYEWFISHLWMSHDQHMNKSCRTKEWDMSRAGMSHINVWMSHVTYSLLFLLLAGGCWADFGGSYRCQRTRAGLHAQYIYIYIDIFTCIRVYICIYTFDFGGSYRCQRTQAGLHVQNIYIHIWISIYIYIWGGFH